ncbi:MAG: hypothetical protein AW07_01906 [Candidatus Accumulibacter sp. SK-11]|nr:MAG: hypothetical protein AW07_01906 [Candidatus Accumulibacter sp. SK-11]
MAQFGVASSNNLESPRSTKSVIVPAAYSSRLSGTAEVAFRKSRGVMKTSSPPGARCRRHFSMKNR